MGRPLIDTTVSAILPKEVSRVVVVANPENHETLAAMKFPVPHTVVIQKKPSGMADAIEAAKSTIGGKSLLVLIADDLVEKELLQQVVAKGRSSDSFGVLPGWRTPTYFPGGYLVVKDSRIVGIKEKPGEGNEPSEFVNISGHFIADSEKLLHALANTRGDSEDRYERALAALMEKEKFVMVAYDGAFSSLKYPWHVLESMNQLLQRVLPYRGRNVEVREHVILEGSVYIDDGVRIFEHTKIVGPSFIGKNTIVGNNNIIRHSVIGSGCITGFGTDITRSYVGDGCWFHSNYVGDSVLEGAISMGAGAVLANLRLDEGDIWSVVKGERVNTKRNKLGAMIAKDVRIGVNASIMPGVKIGHHTFVGAGVVVEKDIPEHSFCRQKSSYEIVRNTRSGSVSSQEEFRKRL